MSLPKPYYQDSAVTLYHGDCREIVPLLGRFDAVVTDIPYGEVNRESSGLRVLDKGAADVFDWTDASVAADLLARTLAHSVYMFCGIEQVSAIRRALIAHGMTTRLCVWEKTNPSPMNGDRLWLSSVESCVFGRRANATFNKMCASPVFRYPCGSSKEHPTQKPIELFSELIQASTNEGETVLDPFAGSGTTGRACKDLGRKCTMIEREERYCEIAARRMGQEVLNLT